MKWKLNLINISSCKSCASALVWLKLSLLSLLLMIKGSETGKPHIIQAQECFVRFRNGLFLSAYISSSKPILVEYQEHGTLILHRFKQESLRF